MFHFWAWCVARHVLFLLVVDVARRGIQVPSNVSTFPRPGRAPVIVASPLSAEAWKKALHLFQSGADGVFDKFMRLK